MTDTISFTQKLGDGSELEFFTNNEVFYPTGTSGVLINAVQSLITFPGTLLDLGCGTGVVGVVLSKLGCASNPLFLSDASPQAVLLAEQNAKLHNVSCDARVGSLYEPWGSMQFDYIIDDVSGIAEDIAKISPWFHNVPCASGSDGADLVVEVLNGAPKHLNEHGKIFFPVLSLSNGERILKAARSNFNNVELLNRKTWPLPGEMTAHLDVIRRLAGEGLIQVEEKFGMVLWHTDIYMAGN